MRIGWPLWPSGPARQCVAIAMAIFCAVIVVSFCQPKPGEISIAHKRPMEYQVWLAGFKSKEGGGQGEPM